jgi:hypothetical protein
MKNKETYQPEGGNSFWLDESSIDWNFVKMREEVIYEGNISTQDLGNNSVFEPTVGNYYAERGGSMIRRDFKIYFIQTK